MVISCINLNCKRSFIDAKAFDGFRKCIEKEFDQIYIVDAGGDIRSGDTTGNVFDIKIGVAVMFLVKTQKEEGNAT